MATCQPISKASIISESKPNDAHPDSPFFMPRTFPDQFERMLFIINENGRLWESWKYRNEEMQSVVQETKRMWELANTKPRNCEKCLELERRIMICERCPELDSRVKKQEDLILNLIKAISKDHDSYEALTQEVTNVTKRTLPIETNNDDSDSSMIMNSPEACRKLKNLETSPIVKRSRNNKRRFKCISSKKKNKLDDEENATNTDLDLDFPDLEIVSYHSKSRIETPDVLDIKDCLPRNKTDEADKTVTEDSSFSCVDDIIEPTQMKTSNRRVQSRSRRSLSFNQNKPNLNDATIEQICEERSKQPNSPEKKPSNPSVETIVMNKPDTAGIVFKSPEKYKQQHPDEFEKEKQKMKWNLTRSREPSTAKLKQTLLTTTTMQKKTDISTMEKFNGGVMYSTGTRENGKPKEAPAESPSKKVTDNKENSVVPSFDSAVTSTANDVLKKTPVKVDKFAKYANIVANSFDVIPKTSPDFKYKRDAVRKKSERRKLPGQGCDMCTKYYRHEGADMGETQIKEMMNRCSRHRDKFAIESNTPPGFWNPVFDDTDPNLIKK